MFRRGRRRKPRVQWLPNPGSQLNQNGVDPLDPPTANPAFIEFSFATTAGAPATTFAPLVVDNPTSEVFSGASLGVFQASALNQTEEFGYRLRRIVGDFFASAVRLTQAADAPPAVLVEAGIIVRRVDSATGQPLAGAADQDVGTIENNADPWVWRRNWILATGGGGQSTDLIRNVNQFPTTTAGYGNSRQQVDQKTARKIGPEERLFLNVSATELPIAPGVNTDSRIQLYFLFDYRVLATVFTSAGNRRNASR